MSQPKITSSDRIRELSEINADVGALVSDAGSAINALTGRPPPRIANRDPNGDIDMDEGDTQAPAGLNGQKEAFTKHTTAYFHHIQSIMARLRRQAYALEEAGIVAAEAPTLSTATSNEPAPRMPGAPGAGVRRGPPGMPAARQPVEETARVTNGGLGNLDVGYLNSRGNRVGVEKEAELVAEARKMLEEIVETQRKDRELVD